MPRYIGAYLRRRAPQGYLFRFAPLRGRPPLRTVYRRSFRRGRCPHRPVCHGSAAASSLPCVKEAQCSHWVVRRSVAEVSRRSRDGGRDTDAPHPLYPSVGEGFYPSCRYCITFRAGQSPAPTPVYRVCATPRSGVIARPVRRLVVAIRPRPGAEHPVYFSTNPNVSLNENLSSPLRKHRHLHRFTEPFTVKSNKTCINAKSQFVHRMLKMTNPALHFYKFC